MTTARNDIKRITRIISDKYNLDSQEIREITAINQRVFRVTLQKGCKVVKFSKKSDLFAVQKELKICQAIEKTALPKPSIEFYGVDNLREIAFLIMADAGSKTVFESQHTSDSAPQELFQDMGEILGNIHAVQFSESGAITEEGIVPHNLEEQLQKVHRLADWAADQQLIRPEEAGKFKTLSIPTPVGFSLCHNDFNSSNCVVENNKIKAIVDWESAWIGNSLMDLALAHAYLEYSCPVELTRAFLTGYHSVKPIPREYERDYLPVKMIQVLGMLKEWHSQGLTMNLPRAISQYRVYAEKL